MSDVKFCQCSMVIASSIMFCWNAVSLLIHRLLIMANVAGQLCGKWILGSLL